MSDGMQMRLSPDKRRLRMWYEGKRLLPSDPDVLTAAFLVAEQENLAVLGVRRMGDRRAVEVILVPE